jgi:hypothetical protein
MFFMPGKPCLSCEKSGPLCWWGYLRGRGACCGFCHREGAKDTHFR